MGPVVDGNQLEASLGWVEARQSGGELAFGGERLSMATKLQCSTLFLNTKNDWEVNQEKCLRNGEARDSCRWPRRSYRDNKRYSRCGLTGGIITQSLRTSAMFKQQAQTGCVMVNHHQQQAPDYHVPFGGRKESSFGPREQGRYAKKFYSSEDQLTSVLTNQLSYIKSG